MHRPIAIIITTALAIVLTPGCATAPRSVLLGVGTGAAAGGVAGYAIAGQTQSATIIGGASGAITGGVIGYLLYKLRENRLGWTETNGEKASWLLRRFVASWSSNDLKQ